MSERTTINVSKEAHQKAKEAKQADESWSDYILRCIDEPNPQSAYPMQEVDTDKIVERLKNELSMANEPTADVDVQGLYDEIEKLQELIERQPEETADMFARKYR